MVKLAFVMEDTPPQENAISQTGLIVSIPHDFTIKDLFERINDIFYQKPFRDQCDLPKEDIFLYPFLVPIEGVLVGVIKINGFRCRSLHEFAGGLLKYNTSWSGAVCTPEAVALFIKNEGYTVDPTDGWKGFYNTNS